MCPLIPVVRDSPTLPARPVGGLSSARSPASRLSAIQQLVLVGSPCCRLRLARNVSATSAGCVARGSHAAAPPPRRDNTSVEEPPTPPPTLDELRPRADSDNKPGSDESVSRQTDCSGHSSPFRRSRSHRAPPIHPATLAPTAPRGSATGRRRRSCRSSQRRSALQQPSSPARRAGQRPSCAIYQPRGLHMARGRRERILSQHPVLGGAALPTGPV